MFAQLSDSYRSTLRTQLCKFNSSLPSEWIKNIYHDALLEMQSVCTNVFSRMITKVLCQPESNQSLIISNWGGNQWVSAEEGEA